jgi:hypothetical protein
MSDCRPTLGFLLLCRMFLSIARSALTSVFGVLLRRPGSLAEVLPHMLGQRTAPDAAAGLLDPLLRH